jgi:hypothetical protein
MLPYIITAVVSIIITALIVWFAAASYEKKSANSKIGNAGIRQDWSKRKRIEKPREELTTTGSAPVPCAVTPTGLHTASRNFVPMSAEESTTTRKPWNSITRKKEI